MQELRKNREIQLNQQTIRCQVLAYLNKIWSCFIFIKLYRQIWLLKLFGKYMDGPRIYFITNDLAFLCHLNYCWAKTKKWHFSYDFFRVPTMIPNPLDDMWIVFSVLMHYKTKTEILFFNTWNFQYQCLSH